MRVYPYLRASTKEQDANRASQSIIDCAHAHNLKISDHWFVENASGATLERPKLKQAIEIAERGDVILVESVDRLARLKYEDWQELGKLLQDKGIQVAFTDVPSSLNLINVNPDDISNRILFAVNDMMIDIFAAQARYDYELRRKRQAEGIKRAQELGKYKQRKRTKETKNKYAMIKDCLKRDMKVTHVRDMFSVSYATIYDLKKEVEIERMNNAANDSTNYTKERM